MRVSIELFLICLMLLGLGIAFCEAAGTANAEALNDELRNLEEQGFEFNQSPAISNSAKSFPPVIMLDSLPSRDVLLIPCSSTGQRGVNVFDPFDGAYVGSFVQDEVLFYTPINAILGPDDNIYVADQVNDAVLVFDRQGTFLYNYADDTDGLDNVRGIDFRDGHLFISISPSTGKAIAEFDGPHNRLADFINDGSDPFDIYFLDDGRALLADIYGSTDNVRLYNADGSLSGQIFSVDFPEQIQSDNRTKNIDHAVNRTKFVEMDRLKFPTVDFCFSLKDCFENQQSFLLYILRKCGILNDLPDIFPRFSSLNCTPRFDYNRHFA